MSKKLKFKLDGRKAYLQNMEKNEALRDILSFHSPGAYYSPAYKLYLRTKDTDNPQGWNGKTSMVKRGVVPLGLLIGAKEEIKEAGYKIKILEWKHKPKVQLKKGLKEKDAQYKFQNKCVFRMITNIPKGGGLVLSATGTGKTKTCAQFFSWIDDRCLFVVDQVNLLYQSQKELALWLKEKVGVVGNSKFEPQRVTVATIQTLWAHRKTSDFKKWLRGLKIVVIDELHKQMSRRNFSVVNLIRPQAVFGLTATLQMKKKNVRWKAFSVAGPVIFEFPVAKGIEQGVLSKQSIVQVEVPDNKIEHVKVLDIEKRDEREYANQVIYNPHVRKLLWALVLQGLSMQLPIVVLCDRIKHLKLMQKELSDFYPKIVYGHTPEKQRQKIIKRFESGKYNLIIASSVFEKGVNIKRIGMIVDVAQRKSKNDALQKLGRGLRKHEKKDFLHYIDLATMPSMKKQASSRRNAFKKAGLKVAVVKVPPITASQIFKLCKEQVNEKIKQKSKRNIARAMSKWR